MAKGLRRLAALGLCAFSTSGLAATLIEFRDGEGETSRIWIEGNVARMEDSEQPGYTLFDLDTGKFRAIDTSTKQVVDLDFGDDTDEGAGGAASADIALEDKGAGPIIAGYPTRRYVLTGDGEVCGTYFLSKKALAESGMRSMAEGLRKNAAPADDADAACDQAESYVVAQYGKLGIPLRELDMEGELVDEVTRIDPKAKTPAGGFAVPSGYKAVSMEQYIQQMMKKQQQK